MEISAQIEAIETVDFEKLFQASFGKRKSRTLLYGTKKEGYQSDTQEFAVMIDINTKKPFILKYAIKGNGWAEIAEQQNPWILLGYISALEVMNGVANSYLVDSLEYKQEQNRLQKEMEENYSNLFFH